jgi:hypothetical protein
MRASHTSPSCSDTHNLNVCNTHRTAPHANAMGATLATAPATRRSMLEFQHSLYYVTHTANACAHRTGCDSPTAETSLRTGPMLEFQLHQSNERRAAVSLGWRCLFRRASTSTRRRRGSHHTGCSIRHSNRTRGHQRKTHIGTPPLSHITIVRSSVRPFRVGVGNPLECELKI